MMKFTIFLVLASCFGAGAFETEPVKEGGGTAA